jgi:Per os infectivity
MLFMYLLVILLLLIIAAVALYVGLLRTVFQTPVYVMERFDNSQVPLIQPPTEIVIEGNPTLCHAQLTPCTTHMDCDQCREGLANCQRFDEPARIVMHDENGEEREVEIKAGESYCLALDRNRARSCNPNTGLWLLVESEVGFSLLCTCLTPGLVTQLNLYEDCNVPVGCQPNGRIRDINERPLQCECDDGFVSDFDLSTETPFCRTLSVRDVVRQRTLYPLQPCPDGFIPINHPALHPGYAEFLTLDREMCIPDPCSRDPVSGQVTSGRLVHHEDGAQVWNYCHCPIDDGVYPVLSETTHILAPSTDPVVNACISPFVMPILLARVDYKSFWGHSTANQLRSDDEMVAVVMNPAHSSSPRYEQVLYPILGVHSEGVDFRGFQVLRFSTAFSPSLRHNNRRNLYGAYLDLGRRRSGPCFYPGFGRCIVSNPWDCIRRHANFQVGTAETFTGDQCYFSREGDMIRNWSPAWWYRRGMYPAAYRVNGNFYMFETSRDATTFYVIFGHVMVGINDDALLALEYTLDSYPNYSINL